MVFCLNDVIWYLQYSFVLFHPYFPKFKLLFNQMLVFLPEIVNWLFFILICLGKKPSQLTANQRFRYSDLVADFVAVISSQSEGLGKVALGIVKTYLGLSFSANRRRSDFVIEWGFGQGDSGDSKNIFRIVLSQSALFAVSCLGPTWPDSKCCFNCLVSYSPELELETNHCGFSTGFSIRLLKPKFRNVFCNFIL